MPVRTAVAAADDHGEEPLTDIGTFLVNAEQYRLENPEQRHGQAYMNFLGQCGETGRELYDMVTGSMYDPFYAHGKHHTRVSSFLSWLSGYLG